MIRSRPEVAEQLSESLPKVALRAERRPDFGRRRRVGPCVGTHRLNLIKVRPKLVDVIQIVVGLAIPNLAKFGRRARNMAKGR